MRAPISSNSTEYVLQVRLLDKQWIQIFNKLSHNRHYRMHKAWHSMISEKIQLKLAFDGALLLV
jgi:hypothetical protein